MIKKRCTDCKYTRGIGYDFWCGEGHTEYEVFGAETNCPYYEYHDWSKGIPSKTKKRFTEIVSTQKVIDNQTGKEYDCLIDDDLLKLLNELHKENEELKAEVYILQDDILNKRVRNLREENKQLKSEIDGFEELLKSYRKTIEHDAELLADASKKGYLPPLENWREL